MIDTVKQQVTIERFVVVCDICPNKAPVGDNLEHAEWLASFSGWAVATDEATGQRLHFCPTCIPHLRPGVAKTTPPEDL
jgi:hypothetical protein